MPAPEAEELVSTTARELATRMVLIEMEAQDNLLARGAKVVQAAPQKNTGPRKSLSVWATA